MRLFWFLLSYFVLLIGGVVLLFEILAYTNPFVALLLGAVFAGVLNYVYNKLADWFFNKEKTN